MWVAWIIASSILFKWYDDKGNLHVTDRLADVPAKYRADFAKQAEEAAKRKPKAPEPWPSPATTPSATSERSGDAYARYQAKVALERATRERADKLKEGIAVARKRIALLEEEHGTLAANPVLNAAQPIRRQRMQEIGEEVAAERAKIASHLDELRKMLIDVKQRDLPEAWVTGL